ncbi:MAG TPA: hypothetical protein VGL78_19240, partial [Solirubrobacteraceae bacterium]
MSPDTGQDPNNQPVPHGDTLSVINGAKCKVVGQGRVRPCGYGARGASPRRRGGGPGHRHRYVANTHDGTSASGPGTVSVVDGSRCNGTRPSGCASQPERHVTVGRDPIGVAVDPGNHSVYVTNPLDDTVSVVNAKTCNRSRTSGCDTRPPTIAVAGAPSWAVVDAARHTVYVPDTVDNSVAVLGDLNCNAGSSVGCRHPA